jgi:hypothetical protein
MDTAEDWEWIKVRCVKPPSGAWQTQDQRGTQDDVVICQEIAKSGHKAGSAREVENILQTNSTMP